MAIKQELEKREKRTCLYDKHLSLGAFMSPFGGFEMPIQYAGIAPEHYAVREKVGLFDVSHMGEVIVRGTDAERYVNHIFTNDVTAMPVGTSRCAMLQTTMDSWLFRGPSRSISWRRCWACPVRN